MKEINRILVSPQVSKNTGGPIALYQKWDENTKDYKNHVAEIMVPVEFQDRQRPDGTITRSMKNEHHFHWASLSEFNGHAEITELQHISAKNIRKTSKWSQRVNSIFCTTFTYPNLTICINPDTVVIGKGGLVTALNGVYEYTPMKTIVNMATSELADLRMTKTGEGHFVSTKQLPFLSYSCQDIVLRQLGFIAKKAGEMFGIEMSSSVEEEIKITL